MFGFEARFEKLGEAMREARQRGLPMFEVETRYVVTSTPKTLRLSLAKRGVQVRQYKLKPLKATKKKKRVSSWP